MAMAAGEYVSVSSQSDTEAADLAREKRELEDDPELELQELASIYQARGVSPDLSLEVARQLNAHDALGHMRAMNSVLPTHPPPVRYKVR